MNRIAHILQKAYRYQERENFVEALYYFDKASNKAPDLYEPWFEMGSCFYSIEDYQGSLQYSLKASEIAPECEQIWYNAAIACRAMGHDNEALGYLNRALKLYPTYQLALLSRISIFTKGESFQEALIDLNLLLSSNTSDFQIINRCLFDRGNCYFKLGAEDFAIIDYSKLLERDPSHWQALKERGYIYYLQNRLEEALRDTNKSLNIQQDRSTLMQRGAIYLKMRDEEKACRDFMMLQQA